MILLVVLFLLSSIKSSEAHKEWVHQYVAQESYRFLEAVGYRVPDLNDHIGFGFYGYGDNNHPWATGYVGVGAWRENLEDLIYRYSTANSYPSYRLLTRTASDIVATLGGSDSNDAFVSSPRFLYKGKRGLSNCDEGNSVSSHSNANTAECFGLGGDSETADAKSRSLFVFIRGGFIDFFKIGLGFQISNQYSLAFKYGTTFLTGGSGYFPPTSSATGVSLSYHFSGEMFNTLTTEFSLLMQSYPTISDFAKGTSAIVMISKNFPFEKGINLYYGLGVGYSKTKVRADWLFIPCLEVGVVYNI